MGEFGGALVAQGFNGTFGGNSYMTLSAGELGGGLVFLLTLLFSAFR